MEQYRKLSTAAKQELVETAYRLGYEYEHKYGNCPQCVIAAIQDVFGLVDDSVFKAAYGLGAGVGRSAKGNCGAMSGTVMIISYLVGRDRENFSAKRKYPLCPQLSREIMQNFEDKYGGILCCDVQKNLFGRSYDLSRDDDYAAFLAAGGHEDKCTDVVGTASRWVAEMIVNERIY